MTHIITTHADAALQQLAGAVMRGSEVGTRQGDRSMELLHVGITLTDPLVREITLAGRKASLPAQIAETMWVLAGRNDVGWLQHYLPRAADFSDDGDTWRAGYGPRIRAFGAGKVDQLRHVVELLRADPLSRRAVISLYDPAVDTQPGKDIACNNWLQFLNREGELHLHVATRSNDLIWGWSGINAYEWSVLLEVVANLLGVKPGRLHFSVGSLHVYDRHWTKANALFEADAPTVAYRAVAASPRFNAPWAVTRLDSQVDHVKRLDALLDRWFQLEGLVRALPDNPQDRAHVYGLVRDFPEPMMRGWLQALGWWWTGDDAWLADIQHTRLAVSLMLSPGAPWRRALPAANTPTPGPTLAPLRTPGQKFSEYVQKLHTDKDRAYGDSWRRRGEMLGIMANIARKVDRLGGGTTADETSADTAVDLLVYLAKYRVWLVQERGAQHPVWEQWTKDWTADPTLTDVQLTNMLLHLVALHGSQVGEPAQLIPELKNEFESLAACVQHGDEALYGTARMVDLMLVGAARVAAKLWHAEANAEGDAIAAHMASQA